MPNPTPTKEQLAAGRRFVHQHSTSSEEWIAGTFVQTIGDELGREFANREEVLRSALRELVESHRPFRIHHCDEGCGPEHQRVKAAWDAAEALIAL